jgi:hypothetical protein
VNIQTAFAIGGVLGLAMGFLLHDAWVLLRAWRKHHGAQEEEEGQPPTEDWTGPGGAVDNPDRVSGVKRWEAMPRWRILIVVVAVIQLGLGGVMINQNKRLADQQDCSRAYAVAEYAAEQPLREAREKLDGADALVWDATQVILGTHATQPDYVALRWAVRNRNRLWEELQAEREAHPPPPPPSTFC